MAALARGRTAAVVVVVVEREKEGRKAEGCKRVALRAEGGGMGWWRRAAWRERDTSAPNSPSPETLQTHLPLGSSLFPSALCQNPFRSSSSSHPPTLAHSISRPLGYLRAAAAVPPPLPKTSSLPLSLHPASDNFYVAEELGGYERPARRRESERRSQREKLELSPK